MRRGLSLVTLAALGVVGVFACSGDRSITGFLSPEGPRRSHFTLDNLKSALGNSATGAASAIVGVRQFGNDFQTAIHGVETAGFPLDGPSYVVISSGDARFVGADAAYAEPCYEDFAFGTNCDAGGFVLDVAIPSSATSLAVSLKYFSMDQPPHRDPVQVLLVPVGNPTGAIMLEQLETCEVGSGTTLRYGPLRTKVVDVVPFRGMTIQLRFEVRDHQDRFLASGALLDNLTFTTGTPTTITPCGGGTPPPPPPCGGEGQPTCPPPPCGGEGQPTCPPPPCGGPGQPTCPPPDADFDGVPDASDNCPTNPNSSQFDQDGDGIGDACDPDRDGDGIVNTSDNCAGIPNADQADSDGDGLGNACDPDKDNDGVLNTSDNCPTVPNPDQANSDGDGLGNACDPDKDNDGVLNGVDNCPTNPNPSQFDQDGDGIGNVCDPDSDGDSVLNTSDNCPTIANPDQADLDGDGIGNACDPDRDGDGALNASDNCPTVANPDQADTDGDGIGNACDPTPYDPITTEPCMNGGWSALGFNDENGCIKFVETGKDKRKDKQKP